MKFFLFLTFTFYFSPAKTQNIDHHSQIIFTSKDKSRIAVNSLYYYKFTEFDSNQNNLSYSVKKIPSWLHYNEADNSISGIPKKIGQYPVIIIATNRKDTISQQYILTVFSKQTTNILCLGN